MQHGGPKPDVYLLKHLKSQLHTSGLVLALQYYLNVVCSKPIYLEIVVRSSIEEDFYFMIFVK